MGLMGAADLLAVLFLFRVAELLHPADIGLRQSAIMAGVTLGVGLCTRLYHSYTRFIEPAQVLRSSGAIGLALLGVVVVGTWSGQPILNAGTTTIYWLLLFCWLMMSRSAIRGLLDLSAMPGAVGPVAIFGANQFGVITARALRAAGRTPHCFIDDKRALGARSINGVPVISLNQFQQLSANLRMAEVVVAVPNASAHRLQQIVAQLQRCQVPVRVLHQLLQFAGDERAPVPLPFELDLRALLGRAPLTGSLAASAHHVGGRAILVTGAGGSIGSELCRQLAQLRPAALHLLDHSEYALYAIRRELAERHPWLPLHAHLGSVCNEGLVRHVLTAGRIDTLYHAAAYKHVAMVEANVVEGLRNNVLGARVVAEAARACAVRTCVLVSTDKAVRPTNVMGASKRIAELIFQAAAAQPGVTTFCMVRFGNVLGSSGSVVPLFREQIARGGPLTVTHPDVTRYFMLIPEAAQLVVQAGALARGGEVFVLDMGVPVRILDLARRMLELAGLKEKRAGTAEGDIEIVFTGLVPGEKLHEELVLDNDLAPSAHPKIFQCRERPPRPDVLAAGIECLMTACTTQQRELIDTMIGSMVGEYRNGSESARPGTRPALPAVPETVPSLS